MLIFQNIDLAVGLVSAAEQTMPMPKIIQPIAIKIRPMTSAVAVCSSYHMPQEAASPMALKAVPAMANTEALTEVFCACGSVGWMPFNR